jgi:hypothetical protein
MVANQKTLRSLHPGLIGSATPRVVMYGSSAPPNRTADFGNSQPRRHRADPIEQLSIRRRTLDAKMCTSPGLEGKSGRTRSRIRETGSCTLSTSTRKQA